MTGQSSDKNLLFGILAVQLSFIDQQQLVASMNAWVLDKSKSLDQLLLERQALSVDRHALLTALVDEHLAMHDNQTEKSLAGLSSIGGVRQQLEKVDDNNLQASLARVSINRQNDEDPYVTVPHKIDAGKLSGRFRILRPHAKGGLGQVSVAQDEELGREVALKEIQSRYADDGESRQRFKFEAEVTGSLEHPGIVPVYGLGHYADGRPYYAMRFIRGDSLQDAIEQFHENDGWNSADCELELRKLLGRFIDVCNAIEFAHSRGVLHRDLKPGNIMLGKYGETLVVDWGLAKVKGRYDEQAVDHEENSLRPNSGSTIEATQMGSMVGTPGYMSPEQAEGRLDEIGTTSDVYCLGATLYCLLSGRSPHSGDDLEARLKSSRTGSIRTLRQDNSKIPHPLEAICRKAMALKPDQRYLSPATLAEEVEKWMADEPVDAHSATTIERFGRLTRKHRSWVFSGVAALALISVFSLVAAVLIDNARQAATKLAGDNRRLADAKQKETQLANEKTSEANDQRKRALESEASVKMLLANVRWDQNRIAEARDLLNPIPVSHRNNFEWNYCSRHFLGSDVTFHGHTSPVNSVAFSPDGTRIASGSEDDTIKVWDAKTGQEIATLEGHTGRVYSVAFSPDGARIASGSGDGSLKVWDAKTGQEITTAKALFAHIFSVAFSPDGTRIALGSDDGSIRVWDFKKGQEMATLKGHLSLVNSVAFSPDGKLIVSGGYDTKIKVWNAKTGQEVTTLYGHTEDVKSVAFSPDGTQIVSGSVDTKIKLWDLKTGKETTTLKGHTDSVNSVTFNPDGARIASGSSDNTIKIWDLKTGQEITTLYGHTASVNSVAFSPDCARIASGNSDNTIKMWDAKTGQETTTLNGHAVNVNSVAFSPDGTQIISGSWDYTIKVWDARTGQEISTLNGHTDNVNSVSFSHDGTRIASGSQDETIKVWDAKTGQEITTLKGHAGWIESLAFSPDGTRIASGCSNEMITVWDLKTAQKITAFKGPAGGGNSVAFSPDGTRIASGSGYDFITYGSDGGTIKVWDAKTGQEIATLNGHTEGVTSVAFAPDGTRIASGRVDQTRKVWDAKTGQETSTLNGHTEGVISVAFSPDGTRIASGSSDNTIKMWDVKTGQETTTLEGHAGGVNSVAFSPDGTRIASGSWDGTIKVWDARAGQEITILKGHANLVRSVTYSPDGALIASGSWDNTIKVWDSKTGQEITTLVGHTNYVRSVAFSPDGARIASASWNGVTDNTIKVWDAKTGLEITTFNGLKGSVNSVAFSPDGNSLFSESSTKISTERLGWNIESEQPLSGTDWNPLDTSQRVSPDGRWQVSSEGNNVVLVDLDFKFTPDEKAYREQKARLDPFWQNEQGKIAKSEKDWFSATFHFAWALKAKPENQEHLKSFKQSFAELKKEYAEKNLKLDPFLKNIVKDTLRKHQVQTD